MTITIPIYWVGFISGCVTAVVALWILAGIANRYTTEDEPDE